jgi:hypothetical protein
MLFEEFRRQKMVQCIGDHGVDRTYERLQSIEKSEVLWKTGKYLLALGAVGNLALGGEPAITGITFLAAAGGEFIDNNNKLLAQEFEHATTGQQR